MKNKKTELFKNQMLNLNKQDLLTVFDYFANDLYTYFENDLIKKKRDSVYSEKDANVCLTEEKQKLYLSYIDDFREVIEKHYNTNNN
jgi:hypothetical protein|tara:strand:+ start:2022 stop:2282 length:261 start_codon:yes stop_codon:yes gene_type:complete